MKILHEFGCSTGWTRATLAKILAARLLATHHHAEPHHDRDQREHGDERPHVAHAALGRNDDDDGARGHLHGDK